MYQPRKKRWVGKGSLAKRMETIDLNQVGTHPKGYCLIGYKTHEGALRNDGRAGSETGPDAIRKALSELHYHGETPLYDAGDVYSKEDNLQELEVDLSEHVASLLERGHHPIIIGGDHSLSWPVYQAIKKVHGMTLSIVNLDAHFDMRDEKTNSGTSFYRIGEDYHEAGMAFPYYVLGLLEYQNSHSLFELADQWQVFYQSAADFDLDQLAKSIGNEPIYMSICMDVFNQLLAPGVSAPDPLGMSAHQALKVIQKLKKQSLVLSLAEVAPPLSKENITEALAARLIYYYMT